MRFCNQLCMCVCSVLVLYVIYMIISQGRKLKIIKGSCVGGRGLPKQALPTKSGYLPINGSSKSKLYYIFYEAISSNVPLEEAPWILWLNGGPGCSSLIGCFYEVGPWWILEDGSIQFNQATWNHRCFVTFHFHLEI